MKNVPSFCSEWPSCCRSAGERVDQRSRSELRHLPCHSLSPHGLRSFSSLTLLPSWRTPSHTSRMP